MDLRIREGKLNGTVEVPASKSMAHRALFCAAFADGETCIQGVGTSDDISATVRAIQALGAVCIQNSGMVTVRPVSMRDSHDITCGDVATAHTYVFDCGESGTTLRFVLPLIGLSGEMAEIGLRGRLGERPISDLTDELSRKGMRFEQSHDMMRAGGKLRAGTYRLPGNVSSQYISSLLIALPLLSDPCRIEIEGPISSEAYVDMTLEMVADFGGRIVRNDQSFMIDPIGKYHSPKNIKVEGDWSSAAFWLTAEALGCHVNIEGLKSSSRQSDRKVTELLPQILAGGSVIDVDACPDLLPALSVAAAVSPGSTVFTGAARLRAKESDRLTGTSRMINALGGSAVVSEDQLMIEGTGKSGKCGTLSGGTVDACADHRMVMSAAVAATVCEGPVTIFGAEAVSKSYPGFWRDHRSLGGYAEEV